MHKWLLSLGVILVAVALGGCKEQPQAQHQVLTPTESDLQEFAHEIEVVESDTTRLQSDVERVRKILQEMEQSLERLQNSTREAKRTVARLQGRPIEDDQPLDQSSLGETISWIIALLLLLMVVLLFVFKYLQTRREGKAQNTSLGGRASGSQEPRSQADSGLSGFAPRGAAHPEESGPDGGGSGIFTEEKSDVPEEPTPGQTEDAPPPSRETPDDVDTEGDKT